MVKTYQPDNREIARHHLQAVLDGHYTLYNNVSKEYIEVTKDTIEGMIDLYSQLSEGHGIEHLIFIKGEHSPISFNTSPTITGDSDTDELLEDERLAQEEVAKELKERADKKAEEYLKEEEHFIKIEEENKEIERLRKIDNNILDAIEDRAVDQQINMMRGK